MKIGPVRISHPFTQAPLEEHSNACFRMLMKQHGASLTCGERVDASHVARGDRRALRALSTSPGEAPRAGQISGANPSTMADAARVVESLGFDIVDLNFDCPVRRLLDRGEGGALLADPPSVGRIVEAVVRAVSIPVSLKIRSGPDDQRETAVEVSRQARSLWTGGTPTEPTARQRVRAMLQLVEDEFRFYGPTVALRRLPRTSCYFAKFLPNYAEFRTAVCEVRNPADFRRLAKEFGA